MILKPSDITANPKARVILYGPPGVAKSTTALSAPNVLFIDADKGWKRIPAQFKTAARIEPTDYQEILSHINKEELEPFETVVIDTGGALLGYMKAWLIKQNPKNAQADGVTLQLKGYGALAQEFERLTNSIFNLGKNLVVIFHSKEEMDGDLKVYRLDVEGQTKNNIFKCMDLAGFVEMRGERIFVNWSPSDRYYAKGTGGVTGSMELPNVMKGAKNDFLTKVFDMLAKNSAEEAKMARAYDELTETVDGALEEVTDVETANKALDLINTLEHVFASEKESKIKLKAKTDALGLVYDKIKKTFEATK